MINSKNEEIYPQDIEDEIIDIINKFDLNLSNIEIIFQSIKDRIEDYEEIK
jgi:hypothetical protein